jgi:S-(hydroxymethyl)glutathione dehydrogenase/alcohol dehydrogenase
VKAAVCFARQAPVRVEEVTLAPPREGEVLVRMAATGVCHSDYSVVTGVMPAELPCVLGHEGAGTVEEVGPGVRDLAPGDRVVLCWVLQCGSCFYCRAGQPHLCEVGGRVNARFRMPDGTTRLRHAGVDLQAFSGLGAMAERVVAPAAAALRLPEDASPETAALIGCAVTTGVGAVLNTAAVAAGSSVAVFGCGGVGLNVIQGAVLAGAETIVAVDVQPRKLQFARRFGATGVVDASQHDPVAALRELTGGRGADYAFEAVGRKTSVEQAYAATRRGGTCVVIGIGSKAEAASVNLFFLPLLDKRLCGCWYGATDIRRDLPRLWELHRAGRLKLGELVTGTYRLDEVNRAFADLADGVNARGMIRFP